MNLINRAYARIGGCGCIYPLCETCDVLSDLIGEVCRLSSDCHEDTIGRCEGGRLIHECGLGDHDGQHECACGHRWVVADDD